MKILGIIPARGGSKRIPGKNSKQFCGRPLISYVLEAAQKSNLLDTIVVNSDDQRVLEIADSYENVVSIKRPTEISGDKAKAIEYVLQTLEYLKVKEKKSFDIVVILQPTSPLTLSEDIDGTINLLLQSNVDSAVSVMKLDHAIHPVKMKLMSGDLLTPFVEEENGRMAEHELPQIFVRNCSVYASKIGVIKDGEIIGKLCNGYLMPMDRSVDINEQIDFDFAEFLYKKKTNKE